MRRADRADLALRIWRQELVDDVVHGADELVVGAGCLGDIGKFDEGVDITGF